jgi:dCMP deaminase
MKWDRRFLRMACEVSTWSKDPSTKVGAVIVDAERNPVSWAFNDFPHGIESTEERWNDRPTKYGLVLHAEVGAILKGDRARMRGATLYVSGAPPCADQCARPIIAAGILRVVGPHRPWKGREEDCQRGADMLREAGIEISYVDLPLDGRFVGIDMGKPGDDTTVVTTIEHGVVTGVLVDPPREYLEMLERDASSERFRDLYLQTPVPADIVVVGQSEARARRWAEKNMKHSFDVMSFEQLVAARPARRYAAALVVDHPSATLDLPALDAALRSLADVVEVHRG